MSNKKTNKLKIINDPVYGFINVPYEPIFDLIESPFFQRLRNIKQLGLAHLVFPGALHTRFHHALGAMHLMGLAIKVLRSKGHEITEDEALGLTQAILLHDIGHGPFSHTLERVLLPDLTHEDLSEIFMHRLNRMPGNNLREAIQIFRGTYPKQALHQLVSGQLDMDRLDYLNRDSYFTGVPEGVVGWDRIIEMLNICDQNLVIDEKGIYSVEKFIIARRLMFWQVYQHKTVLAAEQLLASIIKRAKYLSLAGETLPATPSLARFLKNNYTKKDFACDEKILQDYAMLDDYDVYTAIKVWASYGDLILSQLCDNFIKRNLFRVELQKIPFAKDYVNDIVKKTCNLLKIPTTEAGYFVVEGVTSNSAYDIAIDNILVMGKDGKLTDLAHASDQFNIRALSQPVEKHFLCYLKVL
ncbi:MAG TPA: HD domain-containing protein [Bacteroidales bacterium]|nr:HD domain-containing protein [Bacteroidales bacterium]